MCKPFRFAPVLRAAAALLLIFCLTGCSRGNSQNGSMPSNSSNADESVQTRLAELPMPDLGTDYIAECDFVAIEASGADDGYFYIVGKSEPDKKLKLQVTKGDTTYTYDIIYGDLPEVFPLQMGSGDYQINVYRNVEGNRYTLLCGAKLSAALENEFAPFLLPSQIVSYDRDTGALSEALTLTESAQSDLDKVTEVFDYIAKHVKYDYDKAATVQSGYLPDVDETLSSGKGICYDFAALLAAMLRANGIPAKLVMGYVEPGDLYHAWNMVYITDVGWVHTEIYFDGTDWQLADSTFASTGADSGSYTYYPGREY